MYTHIAATIIFCMVVYHSSGGTTPSQLRVSEIKIHKVFFLKKWMLFLKKNLYINQSVIAHRIRKSKYGSLTRLNKPQASNQNVWPEQTNRLGRSAGGQVYSDDMCRVNIAGAMDRQKPEDHEAPFNTDESFTHSAFKFVMAYEF